MKILNLVIALTLGVILTASLLVPVINGLESDMTETYANGSLTQKYTATPEDVSISYTSGTTFDVNGEEYPLGTYVRMSIFSSDALALQLNSAGGEIYIMQPTINQITATLSEGFTLTATKEGDITLVYGSSNTTITTTYNWAVYLDKTGSYTWVSITDSDPKYIKSTEDDLIFAYSFVSGNNYMTYVDGVAKKNGTDTTVEFTTADVPDTDGKIKTVTNATFNGNMPIVFGFAPTEVNYITPNNSATINLIGVIPVIVLVSLVIMAAGAIYLKRAD